MAACQDGIIKLVREWNASSSRTSSSKELILDSNGFNGLKFSSCVLNGLVRDEAQNLVHDYEIVLRTPGPTEWTICRNESQLHELSTKLRHYNLKCSLPSRSSAKADTSSDPMIPAETPNPGDSRSVTGTIDRCSEITKWLEEVVEQCAIAINDPWAKLVQEFLTVEAMNKSVTEADISNEDTTRSTTQSASTTTRTGKQPDQKRAKPSLEDFTLVRVLGKGSFGKVTLVRGKKDGNLYAMKVLSKPNVLKRKQVEHTKTERRVLGGTSHPFVNSLHCAFQTSGKLYLVLNYCAGGELFFHLQKRGKFTLKETRFYAAEISLALSYLHTVKKVVYRDLKPENILLDLDGHVQLCDFGLAKDGVTDTSGGASSMCGTPEYLAPEMLDRKGHGTAVDWWSLGMVIYELLTGLPPWYTTDRKKLFQRIKLAPLTFPESVPSQAKSLISGMMNRNPSLRLGNEIEALKSHAFFKGLNWDDVYHKRLGAPYKPCAMTRDELDASLQNFEKQFTKMALQSEAEPTDFTYVNMKSAAEPMFPDFTFEDESTPVQIAA